MLHPHAIDPYEYREDGDASAADAVCLDVGEFMRPGRAGGEMHGHRSRRALVAAVSEASGNDYIERALEIVGALAGAQGEQFMSAQQQARRLIREMGEDLAVTLGHKVAA